MKIHILRTYIHGMFKRISIVLTSPFLPLSFSPAPSPAPVPSPVRVRGPAPPRARVAGTRTVCGAGGSTHGAPSGRARPPSPAHCSTGYSLEHTQKGLFNDALNTFYIQIYGEREREMFYLTTHSTHFIYCYMEKERNVLFNDALNTFYIRLYAVREREMFYLTTHSTHFIYGYMEREREMFYLTTHSTHFIYGYMASDIWLRTVLIVRKETRCRHIVYSYRLTARVLLYAPSHRHSWNKSTVCAFITMLYKPVGF